MTLLKHNKAIILILLISAAFLILENLNGRFSMIDYEVYHRAALRLLGGEELYKVFYGDASHYIYKYSPVALYLFVPFTILPLFIAKYVYWAFLTACICYSFYVIPTFFKDKEFKRKNLMLSIVALMMVLHFTRELHLGQVNYVIFTIYLLCFYLYEKGKIKIFSLLLSFSLFIKPFGLLFIPYLIIKQRYKEVIWLIVFTVVLFVSPILFYHSVDSFVLLYKGWVNELLVELSHKQSLLADSNHTIFSVLARYTPLKFLVINEFYAKIYQLCLLGLIGLFTLFFVRKGKYSFSSAVDFSLLIALIPLIAFTSENAFCFTCFAMAVTWLHFSELRFIEKGILLVASLLIGFNYFDIFGRKLSGLIDQMSLISIGAIMLLAVLCTLRFRKLL